MGIDAYYTRLMGLYDELTNLKPQHGCECGHCTCGLTEKIAKDKEEEILHQFLIGLDDDAYGMVRMNLLSQSDLTLEKAYQALIQEEQSRDIARSKPLKEEAHAFALQVDKGKQKTEQVDKSKFFCNHCK